MEKLKQLSLLAGNVPQEEIVKCEQSLATFLKEFSDFRKLAVSDFPQLSAEGLFLDVLTRLEFWKLLLIDTHETVEHAKSETARIQEKWNNEFDHAVTLFQTIHEQEELAFYYDAVALSLLSDVKGNFDDYHHTIQDLHKLVTIGKSNARALTEIGFDLTLLDKAEAHATLLSELRTDLNRHLFRGSEFRKKRGQIYTLTQKDMEEVRRAARLAFANEPEHRKLYRSNDEKARASNLPIDYEQYQDEVEE